MKPNETRTERVTINPELAKKWIARNAKNNRNIRSHRVDQYARDMSAGKWVFNGDSIRFSAGGALVDGQHRLLACIQANVSFESNVVYGLDEESIFTVDSNMTRTAAQMMQMRNGTPYAATLSAALTWLWLYQHKQVQTGRRPSRSEVFSLLEEHPGLEHSVKRVMKLRFNKSISAVCHYLFCRQDQTLADIFFDALESGENMKAGDPVFLLRERLIAIGYSRHRPRVDEIFALFLKSWQATKSGRPVLQLRWMISEAFPSIDDDETTGVTWRGRARKRALVEEKSTTPLTRRTKDVIV